MHLKQHIGHLNQKKILNLNPPTGLLNLSVIHLYCGDLWITIPSEVQVLPTYLHLLTPMTVHWKHLFPMRVHLHPPTPIGARFVASMREKSPRNQKNVASVMKLMCYFNRMSAEKKPGTLGWVHIALAKKSKEAFFKHYLFTSKYLYQRSIVRRYSFSMN